LSAGTHWGAYSASPNSLAVVRENRRDRRGKKGRRGIGREGRGGDIGAW